MPPALRIVKAHSFRQLGYALLMGKTVQTTATAPSRNQAVSDQLYLTESSPDLADVQVLMLSLSGSRAYGLDHEQSDVDIRGLYLAELRQLLGLSAFRPQKSISVGPADDCQLYELGRFAQLAIGSNPTAIELFWTPLLRESEQWRTLRDNRHLFLSQKLINSHIGFAHSAMKQVRQIDAGAEPPNAASKRKKAARTAARVLCQAASLLSTQEMDIRYSHGITGEEPLDEIARQIVELVTKVEAIDTKLPLAPNLQAVNDLIIDLRGF